MSRLASLTPSGTPSRSGTPTKTGGGNNLAGSPAPNSPRTPRGGTPTPVPSRAVETTHHRMVKLVIAEFRGVFKTWDELCLIDGVKAGKGCIDAGTEMDNIIALPEGDERPSVVVHLEKYYDCKIAMEAVIAKLEKALGKMIMLVDQAEKIFFEAYRLQGVDFAMTEPLWSTWTLQHFVDTLGPLITVHNHHLVTLTSLSKTITSPATTFDSARLALERWRDLSIRGERWNAVREWEELVDLELDAGRGDDDEEEEETVAKKGKKKGKR